MSAKFARILLTALSVSALILAGCGDDEDTSPTGPTGTGNTGNTSGTLNAGNLGTVQTPIIAAIARAVVQGPGTYNGAKSGTMTVTRSTGKPIQIGLPNPKYNVVFANYSDDGSLFIDGPLAIEIDLATQGTKTTGDLTLSGTYSAKVGIDISVDGASTPPKYSGTITVDGQKFPVSG